MPWNTWIGPCGRWGTCCSTSAGQLDKVAAAWAAAAGLQWLAPFNWCRCKPVAVICSQLFLRAKTNDLYIGHATRPAQFNFASRSFYHCLAELRTLARICERKSGCVDETLDALFAA